jgi:hypothetical protein
MKTRETERVARLRAERELARAERDRTSAVLSSLRYSPLGGGLYGFAEREAYDDAAEAYLRATDEYRAAVAEDRAEG